MVICVFLLIFWWNQFGRNANNHHSADLAERKSRPFERLFRRNRFESGTGAPPKSLAHSPPKHSATMNPDPNSLARQNQELRDRLQGDAVAYRRRIDTYKQAQQNQAALVARLQSKVLQYKKKCNELEDRMIDTVGPLSPTTKPIKVISSYIYI